MPNVEYMHWQEIFIREPFGPAIELRKHMEICSLLDVIRDLVSIPYIKGSRKKIDSTEYLHSDTHKIVAEVKKAFNRVPGKPWLEGTQEERIELGKSLLSSASKKSKVPITG